MLCRTRLVKFEKYQALSRSSRQDGVEIVSICFVSKEVLVKAVKE